MSIYDVGQH